MLDIEVLTGVTFLMVSSLILLLYLLVGRRHGRLQERLEELTPHGQSFAHADTVAQLARTALPKMGASLLPTNTEERTRLQTRLLHAGCYSRQAMHLFLGIKMSLIVLPIVVGVVLVLSGGVGMQKGLIGVAMLGLVGMIGPSFWLDRRKAERQTSFRRALPDALDVLIICLEGGSSLPAGLRRVAAELRSAHPPLARELTIVQREVQLGLSTGEALRHFGERADLEEIRSLASVVLQSERFGASLVKALRVHAESLRIKRLQRAEEMGQKAVVKILFPTLLFIFPAIFIVTLGPTLAQMLEMFRGFRR